MNSSTVLEIQIQAIEAEIAEIDTLPMRERVRAHAKARLHAKLRRLKAEQKPGPPQEPKAVARYRRILASHGIVRPKKPTRD